jgi:hypothetical protein
MTQYTAMDDFKDYLGLPAVVSTVVENSLEMALTNASAIIDSHTDRTYEATADESHKHDAVENVEGLRLWLNGDLAQLTSVTNGDGAAIPLADLVLEPSVGSPYFALTLKRNSGIYWTYSDDSEEAISVTGRWAYSVIPPDPIVQATLRLAAWLYRQRDNALDLDRTILVGSTVLAPAAMPADVVAILRPYRRVVTI